MKFTDKFVSSLKPSGKKYFANEGRGFNIQVLPTGTKVFVYLYQLNNKRGSMSLGIYPGTSLAKARELYNDAYKLVKNGIDPVTQKVAEKAAVTARVAEDLAQLSHTFESMLEAGVIEDEFIPGTVGQLAAVYYLKYSAAHHTPGVHKNLIYSITGDLLKEWGDKRITEVRRPAAIALVDKVAARAPGQAANVVKVGRQIFEYALQREWVEVQPFLAITKAVPKVAYKPRERILSDAEIRTVWREVMAGTACDEVKRALLLGLVTAQRESEIVQLQRCQIDGRWWTIPGPVTKNRREHRVYLSDLAVELIGEREGYIFPSARGGDHITTAALSHSVSRGEVTEVVLKTMGTREIKDRDNQYFGLPRWTPHDLRRTARTNMARIGVSGEVAEEVLNHKKDKLVGTYNKYGYDKEKQEALIKWEKFLREILAG